MKRLLMLAIVAAVCLAAAPKGKNIVIVHGQEIRLTKRVCGAPLSAIEVVVTDVYNAELVPSEARCTVIRGYMISHLVGKDYLVTVTVTKAYNSPTADTRITRIAGTRSKTFMRPEPGKRMPWALWFKGGTSKESIRVIVNTSFRETGDTE